MRRLSLVSGADLLPLGHAGPVAFRYDGILWAHGVLISIPDTRVISPALGVERND